MPKYSIMVARFPGRGSEASPCVDWLLDAEHALRTHPKIGEVQRWRVTDTPITMGRNRCLRVALERGTDFVLMVDDDLHPDLYAGSDPLARPFLPAALDFALDHPGPCVVAAPYLGPPPRENVYVFRWRNEQGDTPEFNGSIEQYTREEAAQLGGFHRAAALPTGLMLIDMRGVRLLVERKRAAWEASRQAGRPFEPQPLFYYEWKDPFWADEKASTEDVTFSRDLSMAGVPLYCLWDAWAGHIKPKTVGRPLILTDAVVNAAMRAAVARNHVGPTERLIEVRRDPRLPPARNAVPVPAANGAAHE